MLPAFNTLMFGAALYTVHVGTVNIQSTLLFFLNLSALFFQRGEVFHLVVGSDLTLTLILEINYAVQEA